MAQMDEDRLVKDLVAKHRGEFPLTIKKIDVRYGEDSTGNLAVWILVSMDGDPDLSPEKLSRLDDAMKNVKADLAKAGVERWPYFKFEVAS